MPYRNTTCYKIAGTKFFRLASAATIDGFGTNLQNIEKSVRRIYKADEGKILLQCDQSGAEALIVAYLCKPGNYRNLFLHKVKPHSFVALHVFADKWKEKIDSSIVNAALASTIPELNSVSGWPELHEIIKSSDNWKANERYYFIGKKITHSASYGMKGPTFQMDVLAESGGTIVLTLKQANEFLMKFHSLFPEIQAWQREVEYAIKKSYTLYNLFGFPIEFATVNDGMMRDAYSAVPQSTVGCITNIALTNLQTYIEEFKIPWDVLANTHDSYLVQCPNDEIQITLCSNRMTEYMNQDLVSPRGEKFKMKSEINAGYNWSPAHKDKNPDGMGSVKIC